MFPVPLGTAAVLEVLHELAMMRKGLSEARSIIDRGWWGGTVERLFLSRCRMGRSPPSCGVRQTFGGDPNIGSLRSVSTWLEERPLAWGGGEGGFGSTKLSWAETTTSHIPYALSLYGPTFQLAGRGTAFERISTYDLD